MKVFNKKINLLFKKLVKTSLHPVLFRRGGKTQKVNCCSDTFFACFQSKNYSNAEIL